VELSLLGPARPARTTRPADYARLGNTDTALRPCWHPVARAVAIDEVPTKTWLLGEPIVLLRLAGSVVAFYDRCPHRFAPLSAGSVVDGRLACAYHGWTFDASGRSVGIPSLGAEAKIAPNARCEKPFGVVERYGLVFVALDEPLIELPELDSFAPSDRVRVDLEPFTGRYGAGLLLDNQLDVAHFAFVHRETFGTPDATTPPPYELLRQPWGFDFAMSLPIAARNDKGVRAGLRPLEQYRSMRYRFRAPFHLALSLSYPMTGGSTEIIFFVQPETEDRATMYVTLLFSEPEGLSPEALAERVRFEYRVIGEDLALQARFDHLELPLELHAQCHVRADRASIELRRILTALAVASQSSTAASTTPDLVAPKGASA
jgi:vanillate O-demethylase monooxygenase subunit